MEKTELPQIVKIIKITDENSKVRTFFFDRKIKSAPGQFVMVWLPEVDEKPFVLSYDNAVTVEKKGIFSEKMFNLNAGDKIGIRGPYGNGFEIKENACIVAGGLGIAPLVGLIEGMKDSTVIYGAKTKSDYIFNVRLKKIKNIAYCTDDGSFGFKGFVSEKLEELLREKKFDAVYCCGPEIMAKKVFEICEKHKIELQASLERYMKCGFGICGSCAIGSYLVCKGGPVFCSKQLRKIDEFGNSARLKSGKKVLLAEYFNWRAR